MKNEDIYIGLYNGKVHRAVLDPLILEELKYVNNPLEILCNTKTVFGGVQTDIVVRDRARYKVTSVWEDDVYRITIQIVGEQ